MSLSHKSAPDDQELVRYLLELLPEADTERLDEASIADDALAARLHVVERDLVDDYVRGALREDVRERFESRYLASPRRRENVRLAASFLNAIDRAAPPADPPGDGGQPAAGVLASWKAVAGAAIAALLLLSAGTLLYRPAAQPPARAIASLPSKPPGVGREASAQTPVLVLSPQTRAVAAIPSVILPPGATGVAFELRLESEVFPRYEAGLKNPATNEIVWRSGWVTARPAGDRLSVFFTIPASALNPQHYSIDLRGYRPAAVPDIVESYTFRVDSR